MSNRFAKLLLASAAVAAMAASPPAYAQEAPPPPAPVYVDEPLDGTEVPAQPLFGDILPFFGDINPFHGDINPFYGDILPFWGDINPFYGDINPFYGDLNPFWGDIGAFYGDINPFYGDINPFFGDINPFNQDALALPIQGQYWQDFGTAWRGTETLWTDPLLGSQLTLKLNAEITRAQTLWSASIQAQSGQSFEQAFLNPLLARYNINPNDPATLRALSSNQRNRFFLDWYDGLMRYSGTDRVDHWMRTVNWTPAMTQQQGSGFDSIIGLLDATVTGDPDIADNVSWSGGYGSLVNGHGVGVASLMVAAHDRQGVMGIAPHATVIAYNPFDSTGTASWTAIRTGILSLASRNASVINMSLGVAGYALHPDWRKIFGDAEVFAATRNRVFVVAAGNDGVTQLANINWNFARDPNLIIVGSLRTDGTISDSSNRPGTACLIDHYWGWLPYCREQLMYRFITAPGELILVPDGQGGFVRRSGTSFAAPLVSGAITLLHDRWPWLAQHPGETVDIILQSAQDAGLPGVDPVYGHGILDVQASQSPLDYNNLQFYEVRNGVMTARTAAQMRAGGVDTTWETEGVYFHLFEPIGHTFRDFDIPMSSLLSGKVRTSTGALEYFQRFAQRGLDNWIRTGSSGFTDMGMIAMPSVAGLQLSFTAGSPQAYATDGQPAFTPHTALRISDVSSGIGFTAGYGNGAMALNGQAGLALTSDHSRDGGVNPLLALASGGGFANVDLPLSRNTTLSFGVTQDHQVDLGQDYQQQQIELASRQGIEPLDAQAMNVRISHRVTPNLLVSGAYSRIRESNALLGVQSRERTDFGRGATSETATLSASLNAGDGFTFAASATLARTRVAGNPEQGFVTEGNGVVSTAFALSATRQGLLGRNDALRLSVSQPLHIENGRLAYRSVQVVDRTTGELGLVDQPFDAQGDERTLIGELLYEAPILSGNGQIGLFGRAEVQTEGNREINQFSVGSRVTVRF